MVEIKYQLKKLENAQNDYHITAKYVLMLATRAQEFFEGSEVEKKRHLIKLVLQNLCLDGENQLYDAVKPFDILLKNADCIGWRP